MNPKCDDCGAVIKPELYTPGYGRIGDKKVCFACCGKRDRASLVTDTIATLYLSTNPTCVANWPGTLSIPCTVRRGRHNIAGCRYDVWFTGPDGRRWHGVTYGDNTQLCHCRKLAD